MQDDDRENQMVNLFNLTVPEGRGRSDIDAHLNIDGRLISVELKSTTKKSVSTVRDFGPEHIKKWRADLHWIFAFYDESGQKLSHCVYASPEDMEKWIASKERYVRPDILLANSLPGLVSSDMVKSILGEKEIYSPDDAKWIMKKQWSAADYREQFDVDGGYSLERMTEILQLRARYVILRGATLNNPHIEASYFDGFEKITEEHASKLRELVRSYISKASAMDDATA